MKIFNTLSRRKEEFVPIEPGADRPFTILFILEMQDR